PAVGSTSRDRQRTMVDLPEPDSPMMTKTSPSWTFRLASRTAPIRPAAASCSTLGRPPWRSRKRRPPSPKTFQSPRQVSLTPASVPADGRCAAMPVTSCIRQRRPGRAHRDAAPAVPARAPLLRGDPGPPGVLVLVHPLLYDDIRRDAVQVDLADHLADRGVGDLR